MIKYQFYLLYLFFFITQAIASDILINPPHRFTQSSNLRPIRLYYASEELPETQVNDSKIGLLRADILMKAPSSGLYWKASGSPLNCVEYQHVHQAAGAFGVIRLVQALWTRTLASLEDTPRGAEAIFNWTHQRPLEVDPHADCMKECALNAYYDPRRHKLVFPEFKHGTVTKYTCSSFDVVAHEAGHACLHVMAPRLLNSQRLDHKALHECFGDLTALFASLEVATFAQQATWLSAPHNDSCMAGDLTGSCIRDPYKYSDIHCEEHELSKPLTRLLCQYMQYLWKARHMSPQEILKETQQNFLNAILINLDAANILTAMVDYFNTSHVPIKDSYLALLTSHFTRCAVKAA